MLRWQAKNDGLLNLNANTSHIEYELRVASQSRSSVVCGGGGAGPVSQRESLFYLDDVWPLSESPVNSP